MAHPIYVRARLMLDGTLHAWLARYEVGGLAGLADRSKRPRSCPHQMAAEIEALVLEWRRQHPGWGPRRLLHELARAQVAPLPSRSGVYRLLVRHRLIDPAARRRRSEVAALGTGLADGVVAAGRGRRDRAGRRRRGEGVDRSGRSFPEPFVGALPRALLGREAGALAVVGHVDRALGYSFVWPGAGRQTRCTGARSPSSEQVSRPVLRWSTSVTGTPSSRRI